MGLDGHVLLHKALHTCKHWPADGSVPAQLFHAVFAFIKQITDEGIFVTIVFDGADLPAKLRTESSRKAARTKAHTRALQLLQDGPAFAGEARENRRRAFDITPELVGQLVHLLQNFFSEVKFLVAPFEADAMLAALATTGRIDVVLTEDSDLLIYGCPDVLFKWSIPRRTGRRGELQHLNNCVRIRLQDAFETSCSGANIAPGSKLKKKK